jgi:hypothetical protein
MSSLYLKIDLGQSTVFTTDKNYTQATNSYIVGELNKRFDLNNAIFLRSVPTNNLIKVSVFDKLTNLINANNFEYVIQLFLEKIED